MKAFICALLLCFAGTVWGGIPWIDAQQEPQSPIVNAKPDPVVKPKDDNKSWYGYKPMDKFDDDLMVIMGIIGCIAFVTLFVCVVVCKCRKGRNYKSYSPQKLIENEESEDDLTEVEMNAEEAEPFNEI